MTARWGALAALLACATPACLGPASAQSVSVEDMRGQAHHFSTPPQRIVTIPIPSAAMILGIDGGAKRLVGMNPTSLTAIRGEWLGGLFPDSLKIATDVVRGGQFVPNVETLLGLRPDLVFQWSNQGTDLIQPIERAGLRVFGQSYGSQSDLERTTLAMGALLGQSDKAATLVDRQRAVAARLRAAMAGLSDSERPKALYFGRFTQSLRAYGVDSYQVESIALAGGRNPAVGLRGTSTDVTFEQILTWAPEVIFLGGFDEAVPADLFRDPKWAVVPAVRERRVYKLPLGGYRWDPPSLDSALTWIWYATLLHPDRVNFDLRRELDDLMAFLYGRSPNAEETRRILRAAENAASKGYARVIGQ